MATTAGPRADFQTGLANEGNSKEDLKGTMTIPNIKYTKEAKQKLNEAF